jgi:hypothetical protein
MALELTVQINYELKIRLVYFGKPAFSIVAFPVELHRSWLLSHLRFSWTNRVHSHTFVDQQSPLFTYSIFSIDPKRSPRRLLEAIAFILMVTGAIPLALSHTFHSHIIGPESSPPSSPNNPNPKFPLPTFQIPFVNAIPTTSKD